MTNKNESKQKQSLTKSEIPEWYWKITDFVYSNKKAILLSCAGLFIFFLKKNK